MLHVIAKKKKKIKSTLEEFKLQLLMTIFAPHIEKMDIGYHESILLGL